MKIILYILVIALFNNFWAALLPEATVAVVNGTAISVEERDREVKKLLPQLYVHAALSEEKLKNLQEKALDSLIDKTLLYNYAISKNIKVRESEIDEVMTNLAATYGSKKAFEEKIKQLGLSKDHFRDLIRRDETLKKLYIKEIEVKQSEAELKKYYGENMHKFKEPEKIKVRLIYVRNDPKDTEGKEKARKRAQEAQELLKQGENFAYVAQTYSSDPSRVMGGDMGYIHKGMLDPAVEEHAYSMDAGIVSDIIEKDIGYFIVKVDEKSPANQLPFEKVKDKLKKELKEKEEGKRKADLLEMLKRNSVIIK